MPLPVTVAVPTETPPLPQLVGADACGPKTVKVIVPVGIEPADKVAVIELVGIWVPMPSVEGPTTVIPGEAFETTVSDMLALQTVTAELLFESPG